MTLLFFGFLILLVILFIVYTRRLNEIVTYSNERNLKVFGHSYKSVSFLYADISFLNELFSGEKIENCDDIELRRKLASTRRLFMIQLAICCVIFVGIIVNGAM